MNYKATASQVCEGHTSRRAYHTKQGTTSTIQRLWQLTTKRDESQRNVMSHYENVMSHYEHVMSHYEHIMIQHEHVMSHYETW